MTASLQTYARDHLEAIDNLSFAYQILSTAPQDIKEAPADGVIVYGLYLEVHTYVQLFSIHYRYLCDSLCYNMQVLEKVAGSYDIYACVSVVVICYVNFV
jgi:Dynein heavy chain C-terminal domain